MISWDQTDAWVGVFDILGFKNLSEKAGHEFVRMRLTGQLDDLFEVLKSDVTQHGQLKYMVLSDTIVILAPDRQPQWYGWFLLQCTKLMDRSITIKLPLRGAISVGTAFISHCPSMIIGPSVTEAHKYCEDQNWIGLLLTPSAVKELREKLKLEPLHHDFVSDDIPLRKMCADNVLAYRFQQGMSNYESQLISPLEEMKHFAPESDKEKYDKTMAFIKKHYRYIGS
jgi:hypothetical protein